jgi:hypothetical protein
MTGYLGKTDEDSAEMKFKVQIQHRLSNDEYVFFFFFWLAAGAAEERGRHH